MTALLAIIGWTILALILLCAVVYVVRAIACAFECADDDRIYPCAWEDSPPARFAAARTVAEIDAEQRAAGAPCPSSPAALQSSAPFHCSGR